MFQRSGSQWLLRGSREDGWVQLLKHYLLWQNPSGFSLNYPWFFYKATLSSEQLVHKTMHSDFVCFVSGFVFRQRTFNCLEGTEIHPFSCCMSINLIWLSADVLSDRAEHSLFSSPAHLRDWLSSHTNLVSTLAGLLFPIVHCPLVWTGRQTIKWLCKDLIFTASFPTFSSRWYERIAQQLEKPSKFPFQSQTQCHSIHSKKHHEANTKPCSIYRADVQRYT